MIVVTAGTAEFKDFILTQIKRCKEFGYKHICFDLGGLGFGEKAKVKAADLAPTFCGGMPPTTFKPRIMLKKFVHGELMMWMDGDAIPIRPFEPEGTDWDVAVTLRPLPEVGASGIHTTDYINAGIMWSRNVEFMKSWRRTISKYPNDQEALNRTVAPDYTTEQWKAAMNQIITTPEGYRVKVLDASYWNSWHLPPTNATRILHFKKGIRGSAAKYFDF